MNAKEASKRIFSISNKNQHKIISILGLKLKFKKQSFFILILTLHLKKYWQFFFSPAFKYIVWLL